MAEEIRVIAFTKKESTHDEKSKKKKKKLRAPPTKRSLRSMNSSAIVNRLNNLEVELDGIVQKIPSLTTGKPGIVITCIGIFLSLFNMYTDIALGVNYIIDSEIWWGSMTLSLVLFSSSIISIFTFCLHKKSNGKFLKNVDVSKKMVYTLCLFLHGHIARCLMWLKLLIEDFPLIGVKAGLWVFRDITSYAEAFIQSVPQLYVQCYICLIIKGDSSTFQKVCITASMMAASWGLMSQFYGIKWKLLSFELNILWFFARALAIATLASVKKWVSLLLLLTHFVFVFPMWFWQNSYLPCRKRNGSSRGELMITDFFYSIVYAMCNTSTPIMSKYPCCLSVLFVIENITCYILAFSFGSIKRPMSHFQRNHDQYQSYLKQNCFIRNKTAEQTEDEFECEIDFNVWRQSKKVIFLGVICTALAFIQVLILVLLKYFDVVHEDAMNSQLGSSVYKQSQDVRISSGIINSGIIRKDVRCISSNVRTDELSLKSNTVSDRNSTLSLPTHNNIAASINDLSTPNGILCSSIP